MNKSKETPMFGVHTKYGFPVEELINIRKDPRLTHQEETIFSAAAQALSKFFNKQ